MQKLNFLALTLFSLLICSEGQLIALGSSVESVEPVGASITSAVERIDLPVRWRQTKAKYRSNSASTQTEIFRDTWVLEKGRDGLNWLISSNAKVQVYASQSRSQTHSQNELDGTAPHLAVIMTQSSLIKLIGLNRLAYEAQTEGETESDYKSDYEEKDRQGKFNKVARLIVSGEGPDLKTVINLTEEEQYFIQLKVINQKVSDR
jgi:hypothetical protein